MRILTSTLLALLLIASESFAQQPERNDEKRSEDWVFIEGEDLRVGLLKSHGGAIAYLSSQGSDFNVLNHYDHGRLVQQSYYGDEDGSLWVNQPWRFNPVQGGDYQGNAARVLEFTSDENSAYVKTVPRHWTSGELLEECSMEQWVKLDGMIVKVHYRFIYRGQISHRSRHQETPAVFVSPELKTLVTYSGSEPWTEGPLAQFSPGWPNQPVVLSEGWAAYVGGDGKGIGVFVPGCVEATCYRFEGGSGSDCSYIAPLRTFALVPDLAFDYTAYFTLGDVPTIRERFTKLRSTSN